MVLLGGVQTVLGPVVGAVVFKALSIWLMSQTDYSKLVLGFAIVAIVVAFPKGIVGTASDWREQVRGRSFNELVPIRPAMVAIYTSVASGLAWAIAGRRGEAGTPTEDRK
jgi:branched-chain amino acid transport system permease protein